jgi:hypothetical protein
MAAQAITRDEIEDIVVGNAIKHPQYRDALLKNPKQVIETQLNNKLPDGLNVKVVQETGDTIYLRLPHKISEGSELSDESRWFLGRTASDAPSLVDSRQPSEKAERPKDGAILPRPPLQSTPQSSGWVSLPRTYPDAW